MTLPTYCTSKILLIHKIYLNFYIFDKNTLLRPLYKVPIKKLVLLTSTKSFFTSRIDTAGKGMVGVIKGADSQN